MKYTERNSKTPQYLSFILKSCEEFQRGVKMQDSELLREGPGHDMNVKKAV